MALHTSQRVSQQDLQSLDRAKEAFDTDQHNERQTLLQTLLPTLLQIRRWLQQPEQAEAVLIELRQLLHNQPSAKEKFDAKQQTELQQKLQSPQRAVQSELQPKLQSELQQKLQSELQTFDEDQRSKLQTFDKDQRSKLLLLITKLLQQLQPPLPLQPQQLR